MIPDIEHFADITIAKDQTVEDIGEAAALHSRLENGDGDVAQRARYEIRQNHPPNSSP
jgi:hypothetical protein